MSETPFPPEGVDPVQATERLAALFDHAEVNSRTGFSSLFAAVSNQEELSETPTQGDDLAVYDTSSQSDKMRLERDLASLQHQDALDMAGLQFEQAAFSGGLSIIDGQRVVFALSVVNPNQQIVEGVTSLFEHALAKAASQYIPFFDTPEFADFHLRPQLQHETENSFEQDKQTISQVLLHATEIADQLERLGVRQDQADEVRTMHTAELEGMRGAWAVAHYWGLYRQPTISSEWTQWISAEQWQPFYDYLRNAAAKAPKESRFIQELVASMIDKIGSLRNDRQAPPEPSTEYDDGTYDEDYRSFASNVFDEDKYAEEQGWVQEADTLLADVQQKLRGYLAENK